MKRLILICLTAALIVGTLTACSKKTDPTIEDLSNIGTETEIEEVEVNVVNEIIEQDRNDTEEREIVTSKDGKYCYKVNLIGGITLTSFNEEITDMCEIIVPESVDNSKVTKIGPKFLANQENITKITIPSSILIIEYGAFMMNPNLEEIVLNDGLLRIDDCVFLNDANLKNVKLPETLEEIGTSTFAGCESLSAIQLPENLIYLGANSFCGTGIQSIEIPPKIRTILKQTFYSCNHLENVIFKATHIYDIMDQAFAECPNLTIEIINCDNICSTAFNGTKEAKYNQNAVYDNDDDINNTEETGDKE